MGLAAASHTQRISADLFLHRISASLGVKRSGEELALICGEGAAAMEITDEAESILERSFHSRQSTASEFPPEEQAERILRLFRDVDATDKKDAVTCQQFSDDPYDQILALYKEYRPRLFGYLRSLYLGRDEAEDLIQETFMRLTNKLLHKVNIDNFQGWIIHVAHDLAVDVIRRRDRDARLFHDATDFESDSVRDRRSNPDEALLEMERRQAIETALTRFTSQQRQCFHMRAEGFRYKDIGSALGISEQRAALIVKQVIVRLVAICG